MPEIKATPAPDEAPELLDELIKKCYKQLETSFDKNVKIGDFLKMIEFRRKLAPGDADQRKFWNMLDEIRKENLESEPKKTGRKKKTSKNRDTK